MVLRCGGGSGECGCQTCTEFWGVDKQVLCVHLRIKGDDVVDRDACS